VGLGRLHLNLHKTFCIPHGGGGPGVGPCAVKSHLVPFLPAHARRRGNRQSGQRLGQPLGNAAILPISWMYITHDGRKACARPPQTAMLNANYIAKRLAAALRDALHRP
jgi:glycine dehydrogenase